jgi:hypothetical protein
MTTKKPTDEDPHPAPKHPDKQDHKPAEDDPMAKPPDSPPNPNLPPEQPQPHK